MPIADERAKAVELALSQIEKQFGKGSIVRLGSREALVPISVISTGSISFDAALGVAIQLVVRRRGDADRIGHRVSISHHSARASRPGHRQARSRHRMNAAVAAVRRYPGSGGSDVFEHTFANATGVRH